MDEKLRRHLISEVIAACAMLGMAVIAATVFMVELAEMLGPIGG